MRIKVQRISEVPENIGGGSRMCELLVSAVTTHQFFLLRYLEQ